MRRVIAVAVAISLLAWGRYARAVPPVIAWCVQSPGQPDVCSADEERILASIRKRLDGGEGWELGGQIIVTRVQ